VCVFHVDENVEVPLENVLLYSIGFTLNSTGQTTGLNNRSDQTGLCRICLTEEKK